MKLHSLDGKAPVSQAHDYRGSIRLRGAGADFQLFWKAFFRDNQGMIASGRQRAWKVAKNTVAIVFYAADFAMHDLACTDDLSSECRSNRLMPQADAKNWFFPGKITE